MTRADALRDAALTVQRKPRAVEIQAAVAAYCGIPVAKMTEQDRHRSVARPRMVAMYLARELTNHSLPAIGRLFGGRDHTTVIHAIRTVEGLIVCDQDFGACVEFLLRVLAEDEPLRLAA